jgi:hypothetical protein
MGTGGLLRALAFAIQAAIPTTAMLMEAVAPEDSLLISANPTKNITPPRETVTPNTLHLR